MLFYPIRRGNTWGKTGESPEINSKYQRSIILHLGHAHVSGSRDEQINNIMALGHLAQN